MKTTLAWLKEHLETDAPLADIAERLIMLGHDVEGVEDRAAGLEPFTRRLASSRPSRIPNADRLRVCVVDTGNGAGAGGLRRAQRPHRDEGRLRARPARVIPRTGALLKETVIRGVASRGMLCSAYELGLGDDHEGIIELPQDAPVGAPYASLRRARRHRPRHQGDAEPRRLPRRARHRPRPRRRRARAAEAARYDPGRGPLPLADRHPYRGPHRLPAVPRPAHSRRPQRAEPANGCSDRLEAIGLRPISALVDITNFLTFDLEPAAARLRCRPARRRPDGAVREAGREPAGAQRPANTRSIRR